jgi:hypothetical protein
MIRQGNLARCGKTENAVIPLAESVLDSPRQAVCLEISLSLNFEQREVPLTEGGIEMTS